MHIAHCVVMQAERRHPKAAFCCHAVSIVTCWHGTCLPAMRYIVESCDDTVVVHNVWSVCSIAS